MIFQPLRIAEALLHKIDGSRPEDIDFFYKISWNLGIEALESQSYESASILFYLVFKFLDSSSDIDTCTKQIKLMALISCLNAYCKASESSDPTICAISAGKYELLKEAKTLLTELELAEPHLLPSGKRARESTEDVVLTNNFDQQKASKILDILKFQLYLLGNNTKSEAFEALSKLETISGFEDLENLIGNFPLGCFLAYREIVWCLECWESRKIISVELLQGLLQILTSKLIATQQKRVDFVRFSFIYRGMAILALNPATENKKKGAAYEYFKQALEIIKMYPDEYPKEEIGWLAIASYNHALGQVMIDAGSAQAWCELSLSLCHYMGPHRENYEPAIRAGYSKILQRLTQNHHRRFEQY